MGIDLLPFYVYVYSILMKASGASATQEGLKESLCKVVPGLCSLQAKDGLFLTLASVLLR